MTINAYRFDARDSLIEMRSSDPWPARLRVDYADPFPIPSRWEPWPRAGTLRTEELHRHALADDAGNLRAFVYTEHEWLSPTWEAATIEAVSRHVLGYGACLDGARLRTAHELDSRRRDFRDAAHDQLTRGHE